MRLSQVTAERSEIIQAPPDRVWALLSSPEAWSLRRARFAFDITVPPGIRLRMTIGVSARDSFSCPYRIRDEAPGRVMTLYTPDTTPPKQAITLAIASRRQATRVTITVADTVPAGGKPDAKAYWRRELEIWLGRLREVLEGPRAWPGPAVHPALLDACTYRDLLRDPAEASAAVLIKAPISQVWETICAPESLHVADPQRLLCAGKVPGTPRRQPGDMHYYVHGHPAGDGRLTASVYVVRELVHQRSALATQVSAPHFEVRHLLAPEPDGTRFELTYRWPARTPKKSRAALSRLMAGEVRATADAFRDLIEGGGLPGRQGGSPAR